MEKSYKLSYPGVGTETNYMGIGSQTTFSLAVIIYRDTRILWLFGNVCVPWILTSIQI